jgi:hypothetical protein
VQKSKLEKYSVCNANTEGNEKSHVAMDVTPAKRSGKGILISLY